MSQVIKQEAMTQASTLKRGTIMCPASATAPARPPMPAIEGITPMNINQTNHEAFLLRRFVLGPGISEKASRNV